MRLNEENPRYSRRYSYLVIESRISKKLELKAELIYELQLCARQHPSPILIRLIRSQIGRYLRQKLCKNRHIRNETDISGSSDKGENNSYDTVSAACRGHVGCK
ncbi:hypothetical protein BY996DRAFT_6574065 [Phakopsora pachyrhizi]|nr:hypothetical protein BY996DRAFT_6574065 [Phakopsora pachyrhizi]